MRTKLPDGEFKFTRILQPNDIYFFHPPFVDSNDELETIDECIEIINTRLRGNQAAERVNFD